MEPHRGGQSSRSWRGGGGSPAARARVIRSAPVGVEAEGAAGEGLARPLQPERLVLSLRRRPHERRDREAAGTAFLESGKVPPRLVVERPLHMARDDRIPPAQ